MGSYFHLTSSVHVADIRKSPDVSKAHSIPQAGQEELMSVGPFSSTSLIVGLLGSCSSTKPSTVTGLKENKHNHIYPSFSIPLHSNHCSVVLFQSFSPKNYTVTPTNVTIMLLQQVRLLLDILAILMILMILVLWHYLLLITIYCYSNFFANAF